MVPAACLAGKAFEDEAPFVGGMAATTVVGGTFLRCDFTDVVLFGCLFVDCRFERCRFWDTDFHGCTFRRTVFVDSELRVSKDLDFVHCQFDVAPPLGRFTDCWGDAGSLDPRGPLAAAAVVGRVLRLPASLQERLATVIGNRPSIARTLWAVGAGVAVHDALDDADAALSSDVLDLLEQASAIRSVRWSRLELRGVCGVWGAELEVAWRDGKLAISLVTPAELAYRQRARSEGADEARRP